MQPGFLKVLSDPDRTPPTAFPVDGSSGRRLVLAQWLTQPNSRPSALLSRVMVNRLWQHLFGSGLVPTPDNFGISGEAPTHPELLEWLSSTFADGGWRIKPMLKLMMMSTAYRQASHARETVESVAPEKVDPGNRLLWKMRLRRLEAEVIRDALLAVSGQLDATMGVVPACPNQVAAGRHGRAGQTASVGGRRGQPPQHLPPVPPCLQPVALERVRPAARGRQPHAPGDRPCLSRRSPC